MLIILSTSHIRREECHLTWRQMSHSLTLLPPLPLAGTAESPGSSRNCWVQGHTLALATGGPSMHTSLRSAEVGLAWNLEPSSDALAPSLPSFPFLLQLCPRVTAVRKALCQALDTRDRGGCTSLYENNLNDISLVTVGGRRGSGAFLMGPCPHSERVSWV